MLITNRKQTPNDLAEKFYRAEQLRQSRLTDRVSRANGIPTPFPPPPSAHRQHRSSGQDDELDGPPHKRRKQDSRWPTYDPGYPDEDVRIPSRYAMNHQTAYGAAAHAAADFLYGEAGSADAARTKAKARRAEEGIMLQGGPVPSMGKMTIEQYHAWVRAGMDRLRRLDDAIVKEERDSEKIRLEREKEAAREKERRDRESRERKERRKFEKAEAERKAAEAEMGAREADKRARNIWVKQEKDEGRIGERKRYLSRWKAYSGAGEGGADIVEVELAFDDIPWPVYRPRGGYGALDIDMFYKENIRIFLTDIVRDTGATEETMQTAMKKGYRSAILQFHPDKFYGKILGRVRDADVDIVKQAVEVCSRAINDLSSG